MCHNDENKLHPESLLYDFRDAVKFCGYVGLELREKAL